MNRFLLLMIFAGMAMSVEAKHVSACADARIKQKRKGNAKVALASPLLEQYDVLHLKLDLNMSNLTTFLSGNATTTARVIDTGGMARYAFELNDKLSIDSVKINNVRLSAVQISTHVYTINLPAPIPYGVVFNVEIFYHGRPDNGSGFFTNGVNHNVLPTGTEITFTLSDPDLAKDWWPCKQSLTDKIDSAELWFTVPNGTMAGSNGLLQAVTPVSPMSTRYEWKTRYPIEYYLISTAIAPYVEHTQTLHFSGSVDSMPVQHFIYDTAGFYPLYKSAIDSTPGMIDHFSTLFGRYPFWQEKYGHCTAPLSGGMEHQTMTTLGAYTTPLIAHELGHQWWGDCVTYESWRDIWLSEGWAAYCEQLYVERFRGASAAQAYRSNVFGRVMVRPGGTVIVDDTTNVYRVFDARLTYDKGAAVAHMLRYIAPSDSAFFSGLRHYQQLYAYGTAGTAEFKAVMEAAYGRLLDTFFNQWVYSEGFPTYTATWAQQGADVFLKLEQSTSVPASVAAFNMPVEILLRAAAGDTVIRLPFSTTAELFRFRWPNAITRLVIDPANHILNRANPVVQDQTLAVATNAADHLRIYPNPAGESWQLSGLRRGTTLQLRDAAGKIVWQWKDAPERMNIDSSSLAPGIYTLTISDGKGPVISRKLQKQ